MEGALGDLGEDAVHGVDAVLDRPLGDGQNLGTIGGELTTKEPVHQPDLVENEELTTKLKNK